MYYKGFFLRFLRIAKTDHTEIIISHIKMTVMIKVLLPHIAIRPKVIKITREIETPIIILIDTDIIKVIESIDQDHYLLLVVQMKNVSQKIDDIEKIKKKT